MKLKHFRDIISFVTEKPESESEMQPTTKVLQLDDLSKGAVTQVPVIRSWGIIAGDNNVEQ